MTAMVSGFVAAAGYTLTKAEQNIPGTGLAANWNDSYWAPTQGQVDFKVALADGTRDVMVVVERVPVAGEAQAWGGDCWALAMRALAYQNNPDNEFYVFEAWNGVNNPLGVWPAPPLASRFWPEWRTSLTSNHARWVQIQTKSTDGTAAPWNAPAWTVKKPPLSGPYDSCTPAPVQPWSPSKLIPAATALARLYDSLPVGSIDVMSEVFADQIHMNDVGLYFVAAVVYSSIYEQSTMGLSPDMDAAVALVGGNYAGPDETTANALDVMAWNVVSGLWLFE
jgi:hypothetical protein